ncbi:hypothetical protein LWI29_004448 [Acer saccharum]|uniref:Uncharacterized protein n=1 Tax=Acer saccharum TaxID=4024 RepID=A0AA39S3K0_ACESA|nr:hypothetical protein LWI29_004448 [Acer saccharum]
MQHKNPPPLRHQLVFHLRSGGLPLVFGLGFRGLCRRGSLRRRCSRRRGNWRRRVITNSHSEVIELHVLLDLGILLIQICKYLDSLENLRLVEIVPVIRGSSRFCFILNADIQCCSCKNQI